MSLKSKIKKLIKWKSKLTHNFFFNNCVFYIEKFYLKNVTIQFYKSPGIMISLIGKDISNEKIVYEKQLYLNENFNFNFEAEENQVVKFEITLKNKINYRIYNLYVNNGKTYYIPEKKIAHGMGKVKKTLYTNSLEAFKENYTRGFRCFEIDLQLTQDKKVVLFHDSKDYLGNNWLEKKVNEISSEKLRLFKYKNKYPILFLEDLVNILNDYEDVYFILDMKLGYTNTSAYKRIIRKIYVFYMNQVNYEESNLSKKISDFLGKEAIQISDRVILLELLKKLNKNKKMLNRIIPQVHSKNMELIYNCYNFPLKIWRDNRGSFEEDINLLLKNNVLNYSRNASKLSREEEKKIKEKKINLYLYNTSVLSEEEKTFGYFID